MSEGMTVGQRIRAYRRRMSLSVDELAARIGKNRATVYRYENGEIPDVTLSVIQGIAKALDVPPAVLAGWEKEKGPCGCTHEPDETFAEFAGI